MEKWTELSECMANSACRSEVEEERDTLQGDHDAAVAAKKESGAKLNKQRKENKDDGVCTTEESKEKGTLWIDGEEQHSESMLECHHRNWWTVILSVMASGLLIAGLIGTLVYACYFYERSTFNQRVKQSEIEMQWERAVRKEEERRMRRKMQKRASRNFELDSQQVIVHQPSYATPSYVVPYPQALPTTSQYVVGNNAPFHVGGGSLYNSRVVASQPVISRVRHTE